MGPGHRDVGPWNSPELLSLSLFQEGNLAGCLFLCDAWTDPGSGESGTLSVNSLWEGRMW